MIKKEIYSLKNYLHSFPPRNKREKEPWEVDERERTFSFLLVLKVIFLIIDDKDNFYMRAYIARVFDVDRDDVVEIWKFI